MLSTVPMLIVRDMEAIPPYIPFPSIVWLLAILKASKGEFYKLPIIGDFSAKQANI